MAWQTPLRTSSDLRPRESLVFNTAGKISKMQIDTSARVENALLLEFLHVPGGDSSLGQGVKRFSNSESVKSFSNFENVKSFSQSEGL